MKTQNIPRIALLLLFLVSCIAHAQEFKWATKCSGVYGSLGLAVATDNNGNVYSAGIFVDTVDVDPGPGLYKFTSYGDQDIYIVKQDSSGNLLWAGQIGGSETDVVYDIDVDDFGNVYLVGNFEGSLDADPGSGTSTLISSGNLDVFYAKISPSGSLLWAKRIGGTGREQGHTITIDASGFVYAAGAFEATADFDPGPGTYTLTSTGTWNVFINKLDPNGNFIWAKALNGSNVFSEPKSIDVDAAGNVYTVGYFDHTVDFDPGPGSYNLTYISTNHFDAFICKLNSIGNFVWAKQIGGTGINDFNSVQVDQNGDILIGGYFYGSTDFDPGPDTSQLSTSNWTEPNGIIAKYAGTGDFLWVKHFEGSETGIVVKALVDAAGNIYALGTFSDYIDLNPGTSTYALYSLGNIDIFLVKLNSAGNFNWAARFGGVGEDLGYNMSLGTNGNILLTGSFTEIADFNPGNGTFNLSSDGNLNAFVCKIGSKFTSVDFENADSRHLTAYPNPTSGIFSIDLDRIFEHVKVTVRDAQGRMIHQQDFSSTHQIQYHITGDAGLYYVYIETKNGPIQSILVVKYD